MEFFTSDTHFNHSNIIKYCHRPFRSVEDMNRVLLANINASVRPNDILWHLGDFSWTDPPSFLSLIKCNNIKLILGNHDYRWRQKLKRIAEDGNKLELWSGFADIKFNGQKITLCHYPMRSWCAKAHGAWHLHGHVHGTINDQVAYSLDVGVDAANFMPVSLDEVHRQMGKFD